MEVKAQARYIRIAPRKARQAIDAVRGMDPATASRTLMFSTKRAAGIVRKVIDSAVANAENNHKLQAGNLVIAEAYVNEGPTLKRFRPRAQGRAARINKRTSHITIVVRERSAREA